MTTIVQRALLEKIPGMSFSVIKYLEAMGPDIATVRQDIATALNIANTAEADAQEALLQIGIAYAIAQKAQQKAIKALEESSIMLSAENAKLRAKLKNLDQRISDLEMKP